MIAEYIEEYYTNARKPVDDIISQNREYFDDLYDIGIIYVWGFSFSDVDMPYLKEIIAVNDNPTEIKWHVSYYKDEEIALFRSKLSTIGIDCDRQVFVHPLSSWQIARK